MKSVEIRHFHLFCGLGGGARGFNRGDARLNNLQARFRCIGGIDVDRGAVADFERLAGIKATHLDLFSREQYLRFHGQQPPVEWIECGPDDIRKAAGGLRPHIVFTSPPCKGFSGLLSAARSRTEKYLALNALTLRGIWLSLEAWRDDPPEFFLLENVPRIQNRGRELLDQIVSLLQAYGYATAETTHDCGELGNLAQSRKRFLLVARHQVKVPPFLYEPAKRPLRGVGEVIGRLPVPGAGRGGPMHRVPSLQWKTWVRLAFVEAGSDWRSLNRLRVEDGILADFGIVPEAAMFRGALGVTEWDQPGATVTGEGLPYNGRYAVADPRVDGHPKSVQLGVRPWDRAAGVVTGKMVAGGGPHSVADPRLGDGPAGPHFNNVYRVVDWNEWARTISAGGSPSAGGLSVADPRVGYGADSHRNKLAIIDWSKPARVITSGSQVQGGALSVADPRPPESWPGGKYRVTGFDEAAGAVIAASTTGNGAFAVADPRPGLDRARGDDYLTAGHYGVVPWTAPAYAITGTSKHDNGHGNVADPRLPEATDRLVAMIRAIDGTWHRPFTTLELAALQGLVDPEEHLELDGLSDSGWRERIGNAVPSPAARAIAGVMGRALLGAWTGETFALSSEPVWVRPVAIAISVQKPQPEEPMP